MSETNEKQHFLGLKEILSAESIREYFKIDSKEEWTLWHISRKLKVNQKWLEGIFAYPGNSETSKFDWKTNSMNKLEKYYWGDPRVNNEYAVVGDVGNYQLYMKKWQDVVKITLPDDKITIPKSKSEVLADTQTTLSGLKNEIQSA